MGMQVVYAGQRGCGHFDDAERLAGGECYAILGEGPDSWASIQSFGEVD
jgi:hypothetical protein